MITEVLNEADLVELLKKDHPLCRFPSVSDRAAWQRIKTGALTRKKARLLLGASNLLLKQSKTGQIYPDITSEQAFDFVRTGNRDTFQDPYYRRRMILTTLVLGECIEDKGRFMPQIMEGLWKLVSEPYWYISAHGFYGDGDPMPWHDCRFPDLFACETVMTLAMTEAVLGDRIRKVSAQMLEWIHDLADNRVFTPVEKSNPWWFRGANNWSPWCASNTVGAAIVFLKDQPERLAKIMLSMAGVCDRYYDTLAFEGGCDEGPGYFTVAGMKLMNFIDHMDLATNGAYSRLFSEPKMKNIAEYPVRVNASGSWYINPADADAKMHFRSGLLLRFAELVGSGELYGFVLNQADSPEKTPEEYIATRYGKHVLENMLQDLFFMPARAGGKSAKRSLFTAQTDLQLYVMRQSQNEAKGAIMSIKGGHNAENHNHNDIGQFELFFDGSPLIVDLGSSSYTRFTFMQETRYKSFVHGAQGHNIPQFNGILQQFGREYHAGVVEAEQGRVALDLTNAYPAECGLKSYIRTAKLDKNTCSLEESVTFDGQGENKVILNLFCAVRPRKCGECIKLGTLRMFADGIDFDRIEKIPINDPKLIHSWGKAVYRIGFTGLYRDSANWSFRWER